MTDRDKMMSQILLGLQTVNNNVSSVSREVGEIKVTVSNLEKRIDDLAKIKETVDSHAILVANAKFGWKMVGALCGACASIGAAASWLLTHLSK